ncbi:hypothetical protein [Paracoccus niistensis]|uniref:Twin-arginine translocation signal domain-containing protein n=1 Tax=Paracoccus niistensis TaxID=632935 RepID=A0ABV6I0N2_9RHOB
MNRRALLKAAPALAMAGAVPAMASEGDTPILRLFRQHQAINDAAMVHVCVATGKDEDEELDRLFYRERDRIQDEMMALPCTCAADFAAKVIVDTCNGGLFSDWETGAIWQEARALTGGAA